jgi:hypothetical protein
VPNPDGKSWDVLQWYLEYNWGRQELFIIDLGTGQVKKGHPIPTINSIYLSGRALGFDGKYYIVTQTRSGGGLHMFIYNPGTNSIEDAGLIMPQLAGELSPIVVGPDGRIYGTGPGAKGKVGLYIYDPKLRKVVKDFGLVGPSHFVGSTIASSIGVDDTHAYIVSGCAPAYLVAVNLETGEEKVLFETPDVLAPSGSRMEIIECFPGAWAQVPGFESASDRQYWLYHGQAIPKVDDSPPWPKRPSSWDKSAATKPELYYAQIEPDEQGNATLWYRLPEDAAKAPKEPPAGSKPEDLGWRSIGLKGVDFYAGRIGPMALLPDGRLYGAAEYYIGSFLFDPKTDKSTLLGRKQGLSAYTRLVYGDKCYSCGYPGGPLHSFDPKLPWTLHKGGPPGAPGPETVDNPRYLGSFEAGFTRTAVMHSSALGADDKIYFGGFGKRHYDGGGFGWYAPKTGSMGGFWKPLSGYAVYYLAPVLEGRLIAISTATNPDELNENRVPEEAKLFFYDVEQGRIVKQVVPVPKARATGLITKASPGRLLGLTVEGSDYGQPGAGILYGVEVNTGEVLFSKRLPWTVSIDDYWPHWVDPGDEYLDLVHGPDGFIWTYLKDVLVRIDPKDATVYIVGRIEPPGRPTFVGNDLYFSGSKQLRRIRNIVPAL